MAQNSFILYYDVGDLFLLSSDENAGKLIKAIFEYERSSGENVPKVDADLLPLFALIRNKLDTNRVKYSEKCEKNRKNIEEWWERKKGNSNERIPPNTNEYERIPKHTDTDTDTDTDLINNNIIIGDVSPTAKAATTQKKKFVKPTVEEIEDFCNSENINVDANKFFNYYESCGWVLNGNKKMVSWKAAIRYWAKNGFDSNNKQPKQSNNPFLAYLKNGGNNYDQK